MIASIDKAIDTLKNGKMIILVDDENRENEGDLCMLAERITPQDINFMAHYGCGLICMTITQQRADQLNLHPQTAQNTSRFHTGFTTSIEAAQGVTTGISAFDRATTIKTAAAPNATPNDLAQPGHVFPIIAQNGGVLVRVGQTEGSVDLAKIANANVHAGVICEIMKDDGSMARMPDLEIFSQIHDIPIISIADIIQYRLQRESLVQITQKHPILDGIAKDFTAITFKTLIDNTPILALCYNLDGQHNTLPLVRVHAGAPWCDLLGLNDNRHALSRALQTIKSYGYGCLLYIQKEYAQLENTFGLPTQTNSDDVNRVPPETRFYGIGAQCLRALSLSNMILLSDTPQKLVALKAFGLNIDHTIPLFES